MYSSGLQLKTKIEKEILRRIKLFTRNVQDRQILKVIVEAGGSAPRIVLLKKLVPKHMAKLTFQRHLKSLTERKALVRGAGELEEKPVVVYRLGPMVSLNLLELVDRDLIKLAYRAAHDLEVKAKTDEQRRKVIERAVEDTFKLQRSFTLRTIAKCLQESDERKMVRAFLWLMDNISTQAVSHLMVLCHIYPEVAGPVIERLAEEAGKEEVQILEFQPRPKKSPPRGRR